MVKNLPLPNNTTITVKNKKQSKWLHVFKKKKKTCKDPQEAEKHLSRTVEWNTRSAKYKLR